MWNTSQATSPIPAGDVTMENLYPALLECFAIIICGYVAGRANLISQTEAKGLNTFVGSFCLPSLIFLSLAELNLTAVNWSFMLAILVAKTIVFAVVLVITLLIGRPVNLGRAGLFAIFCTQSNDFAIGYPIVVALYHKTHPDFPSYLYLLAPISLVILNPVGFVLMELEKRRETNIEHGEKGSKLRLAAAVAKSIVLNPIVLMTALGIIGNFVFSHGLPTWLAGILKVLGSAFSATALFLLGLRMVGKVHTLQGAGLVVPGILIAVKLLALPLVTREVVSVFHSGVNVTDSLDLSTYGFLYGTFPSAPGVFVYAMQYSLDVDLIASAMVACTFLSAPLMAISAKMIAINKMNPSDYLTEFNNFVFVISILGIVACVWLLVVFVCSKKYKRIPHRITCCLVISQLVGCVGIVLWSLLDRRQAWALYLQFAVYAVGVYSSRLWTAFLAVGLFFLQSRSLCFVLNLQPVFIVLGWGLPLVIVTLLILTVTPDTASPEKYNPNFQYGEAQAAISVFVLILCFIVTVGCLVLHQRSRRRYARYLLLVQDMSASDTDVEPARLKCVDNKSQDCTGAGCGSQGCSVNSPVVDIEEIATTRSPAEGEMCPSSYDCPSALRDECNSVVRRYLTEEQEEWEGDEQEEQQLLRHVVLLILLVCSMFVGIAISVWTLVMEAPSGIYVELSFLDASLNFGQSLIVFAVFGLDTKVVMLPLLKRWRKLWYHGAELVLPPWEELDFETRHVCDQFVTHHLTKCRTDIAKDKRCRLHLYRQVFQGTELVDWLLGVGLARDRTEAVQYATHLVEGRVVRHINNQHHFLDSSLLYLFPQQ